jgi:hypothetical protein
MLFVGIQSPNRVIKQMMLTKDDNSHSTLPNHTNSLLTH